MSYDVIRDIPAPIRLRVEFDNPVDPSQPLIVERIIEIGQEDIRIQSETLTAIEDGGIYTVSAYGYATDSSELLFQHIQPVQYIRPPGL